MKSVKVAQKIGRDDEQHQGDDENEAAAWQDGSGSEGAKGEEDAADGLLWTMLIRVGSVLQPPDSVGSEQEEQDLFVNWVKGAGETHDAEEKWQQHTAMMAHAREAKRELQRKPAASWERDIAACAAACGWRWQLLRRGVIFMSTRRHVDQ